MRTVRLLISVTLIAVLGSSCAVNLPFNNRMAYAKVTEAKKLALPNREPIALHWVPPEFVNRVDIQGASGFVGGGSHTRIPTGVALSNRVSEALDTAIGIDENSPRRLTITVVKAETKFRYSGAIHVTTPTIVWGMCTLDAGFEIDGMKWNETFTSTAEEDKFGGTSETGILERVWDDTALQVVRSITQHLAGSKERPLG